MIVDVRSWLQDLNVKWETDIPRLQNWVVQLSTLFQQNEKTTPWDDPQLQAAYLSYFFPLNSLRVNRVLSLIPNEFWRDVRVIREFGSGPGTFHSQWIQTAQAADTPYEVIERSDVAFGWHNRFAQEFHQPKPKRIVGSAPVAPHTLAVACYSLNEVKDIPTWFWQSDKIMIIDAAQREVARNLMTLRQQALDKGYHVVAPCTHKGACPLLTHSKHDFCHDRFQAQLPAWLEQLHEGLPMQNRTLTHSYFVLTRTPLDTPVKPLTRVIGDTLFEKGKVRQAICRSSDREFLSALKRELPDFAGFQHGSLIQVPASAQRKGNEVRLNAQSLLELSKADLDNIFSGS